MRDTDRPMNHRVANSRRPENLPEALGIIIPAYHPESGHLPELLERITRTAYRQGTRITIVDDGSVPPIRLPAGYPMATVLRHPRNFGKGAALKTGFGYLLKNTRVNWIATLDADLQHPPEKIPEFLEAARAASWDLVVGYRQRDPRRMPPHRILSNSLTSLIISLLTGTLVRDSQCGFRLIHRRVLEQIQLSENRFHLESEMLIKAGWSRFRIGFVAIPTIYNGQKSAISHVADTLNFISLIGRLAKERIESL